MKTPINIIFVMAFHLFATAAASGSQDNKVLNMALKSYENAHYRKAMHYFKKALGSTSKDNKDKFAQYAVETIKKQKEALCEIEKEESVFRLSARSSFLVKALSEKHHAFAKKLLSQPTFYLPMVEPHLKRAIELNPKNVDARLDLADTYYASAEYDKARKVYEDVIRLDEHNLYAYRKAGDSSAAAGDFDGAKRFYSDLIDLNEEANLAYEARELKKIKDAIKTLPYTYWDVDELLRSGKLEEAKAISKKRIAVDPADYVAMTKLGFIYQDEGDRRSALRLLNQATKMAPDYPVAHFFLGRLYFVMQNYDEAVSELNLFKEKMKRLPNMEGAVKKLYINNLYYLSEVYFTLKKYDESRKELEEILKLDPAQQDAHYDLGVYYYVKVNKRSKAYQSFTKAIEIDPTTHTANSARYAIEFIRNNPDPRFASDFSFIDRE